MDAIQVAIASRVAEQHRHHGKSQFFWVWGALLIMTGIEVYLAYQNMQPKRMLSILMGLSLIKAGLIIAYFQTTNKPLQTTIMSFAQGGLFIPVILIAQAAGTAGYPHSHWGPRYSKR